MARKDAKAVAVKSSGEVAVYKDELRQLAKAQSDREKSSGSAFVKTKGSKFEFKGAVLKAPLKVIVLGYSFENAYYVGTYDPDNKAPPVCFAMSNFEEDLKPHETSPEMQHDTCKDCAQNQWASAATGRGKACKNQRRLLLLSVPTTKTGDFDEAAFTPEYIKGAELAQLRLSPTAIMAWSSYVKQVTNTLNVPLFAVVTALAFNEDEDYPQVITSLDQELNDMDVIRALSTRATQGANDLHTPYDVSGYAPKPQKPAKKRGK